MRASEALRAPAKLNLTLEVLGRRSDGLHGLRSVMVPISLADELRVARGDASFRFTCDVPALQNDNLVTRAFAALPLADRNFEIFLEKRIPTGAGMGGGSSDAAAVLLAAGRGVFGELPALDYLQAARSLGSDVPFFLVETAALVEGVGERVTALGPVPPWHVVIVKPPIEISTAWAYATIDEIERPTRPRNASVSVQMAQAIQRADFLSAASLLQNDFQNALSSAGEIRRALDALDKAGAAHTLLTGSGSCVYALCESPSEADRVASRLDLEPGYASYTAAFWNGEAWRSAA
ncbi:MAG TPA: 4-(cytidine 5'-diphospho)-2-C-methyl-D-erythritol kinase [Candidatus Baltobacteraceae bacterium]|nr:4-(cytidine 5'-diphospho)-2-C-methyl-D-erythritol kinase [Candidatus Baltobacteraceae bacterium]